MSVVVDCEVFGCKYNEGGECIADYIGIDLQGECDSYEFKEEIEESDE